MFIKLSNFILVLFLLFSSCNSSKSKKKFNSLAEGKWYSEFCNNFGSYYGKLYSEVVGNIQSGVVVSFSDDECTTFSGLKNFDGEPATELFVLTRIEKVITFEEPEAEGYFAWEYKGGDEVDAPTQYTLLFKGNNSLYGAMLGTNTFPGLEWSRWLTNDDLGAFAQDYDYSEFGSFIKVELPPSEVLTAL